MAKSHRKILIFLTWMLVSQAISAQPIDGLLKRILPDDFHRFSCQKTTLENRQTTFTIACDGEKIDISGTDNVAIAAGINWFLQHHAGINISWNNPSDRLPEKLPVVAPETHTASVDFRYSLNFCTHSYSMAFWDWNRWQQEIDWMALHGINLPLIITGMESVWKEVLMGGYGYENLAQVNEFVTGPAYFGWFFMNNMTAWGGPLPESWYEQRAELGRKIFQRL
ncbi:MAG: alpha-N-acetylglucosaminidase N-terminal domain-containing protein, partial [Prevotella sp.]|nr:alpha-N-acetylglucosaminidase N-terminal domain-containing protein [Prevotella sp.]